MARLDLEDGFTLAELKRRYKSWRRSTTPICTAATRRPRRRLKLINEAYTFLREQQLYA